MSKEKKVHMSAINEHGTECGKKWEDVLSTADKSNVTCKNCLRILNKQSVNKPLEQKEEWTPKEGDKVLARDKDDTEFKETEYHHKYKDVHFCLNWFNDTSFSVVFYDEIKPLEPQFKKGDVILCKSGFKTRLHSSDNYNKWSSYSSLWNDGELTFDNTSRHNTCETHRIESKLKGSELEDYEREEKLNGKIWNSETEEYDDFLTYDGVTLKELLEHDLSEIEWWFDGSKNWDCIKNTGFKTKEDVIKAIVLKKHSIKKLRLKPQPKYKPFTHESPICGCQVVSKITGNKFIVLAQFNDYILLPTIGKVLYSELLEQYEYNNETPCGDLND